MENSQVNNSDCIYFWRADEAYGFLSNFFICPVLYNGIIFHSSEQVYMWLKAKDFGDFESCAKIAVAKTPKDAKILGRKVSGFNESEWERVRLERMHEALMCKFTANPSLKQSLLDTENKVLIEASPRDSIWGIGMDTKTATANFGKWEGLNLLGQALMKVRDRLK